MASTKIKGITIEIDKLSIKYCEKYQRKKSITKVECFT